MLQDLRRPLHRPPWALLCWTLLWWAPFAVTRHTLPLTAFYGEALAALLGSLATALTLWSWCSSNGPTLPRNGLIHPLFWPLVVPWLLWALWALQPFGPVALVPRVNVAVALGMGLAVLVMHGGAVSRYATWSDRLEAWIAHVLVIGGVLTVGGQLLQLVGFDELYAPLTMVMAPGPDRRLFGSLGQANHTATYLAFGLAALVFLVQTRRWSWLWALPVAAVLCVGEAFTVSRTPLIQVVAIAALGAFSAWRHDRPAAGRVRWRAVRFPLLLPPLLGLVSLGVSQANQRWGWNLATSAMQRLRDVHQMSPRMALWQGGLDLFRAHPWTGVGWGNYAWYQYLDVLATGPVEPALSAHNLVLDLLAKTGLIGAVLVLVPLAVWALRQIRGTGSPERTLGLTLIGVLALHTLVEFPENYLFFLLPAAGLLGRWAAPGPAQLAGLSPDRSRVLPRPVRFGWWRAGVILALLGSLGTLGVTLAYTQAEQALSAAQVPALGVVARPEATGLARWFNPWLQALAWPRTVQRTALDPNGVDPRFAQALTLAPRLDSMRETMLALGRAGRTMEAGQAARRWHAFAVGDQQWAAERRTALAIGRSDSRLSDLVRLIDGWPVTMNGEIVRKGIPVASLSP